MNDGPINDAKNQRKERMRFVSAEQVAQLAGVSRSAVSRTFTPVSYTHLTLPTKRIV